MPRHAAPEGVVGVLADVAADGRDRAALRHEGGEAGLQHVGAALAPELLGAAKRVPRPQFLKQRVEALVRLVGAGWGDAKDCPRCRTSIGPARASCASGRVRVATSAVSYAAAMRVIAPPMRADCNGSAPSSSTWTVGRPRSTARAKSRSMTTTAIAWPFCNSSLPWS